MGDCIFGYHPAFVMLVSTFYDILSGTATLGLRAEAWGRLGDEAERFFYRLVSPG